MRTIHCPKNLLLLLGISFFSIALSACGDRSQSTKVWVKQLGDMSQIASQGGNYSIAFSPPSTSMPLNQYFDMDVLVKGPTEQFLAYPVTLKIDAGMKAHNHGMNVNPKVIRLGNGHFKVEGMMFHMPGKWFLRFFIYRGAMSDKAELNVVIQP